MIKYTLPLILLVCSGTSWAATCLNHRDTFRSWVSKGEPYSVAVCDGLDPQKVFEEANADVLRATTNRHWDPQSTIKLTALTKAAKAALEAGLNDKAKSYAQQALQLAKQDRCINSMHGPVERKAQWNATSHIPEYLSDRAESDFCLAPFDRAYDSDSDGDVIAASNFILGRLALQRGDVKKAEKFLLQSGTIRGGQSSSMFGPNTTLALELLKRGRSEAVLRFLDEWSKIWEGNGKITIQQWTAAIRNGEIPDFGANLLR